MKEKLATAVVGALFAFGFVIMTGEAETMELDVLLKIIGISTAGLGGLLYKIFDKKGLFNKFYAEWRKECLTNKD